MDPPMRSCADAAAAPPARRQPPRPRPRLATEWESARPPPPPLRAGRRAAAPSHRAASASGLRPPPSRQAGPLHRVADWRAPPGSGLPFRAEWSTASPSAATVMERIMDAEGAELEVLIGLSSQICKVIPEDFARELENGQVKQRFVKRLVDALNANMKPSACCPGIRRVILEQAIYMMECNSRYANCFNECRMMEALSVVEETPSKAENYRLFLGDAGFMEYNEPLSSLVDRAKELMGHQWLRGVSSVA